MRRLSVAAVMVALALTGCSAQEPAQSPAPTSAAPSAAVSSATPMTPPAAEASDEAESDQEPSSAATGAPATGAPATGAGQATGAAPPELVPNEFTEVCADVMQQVAPLTQQALEQIDDPAAVSSLYGQMADIFADGVERVDGQEVKDAFTSMADSFRNVADNNLGEASSEQMNDANEQFGAACFGG